MSDWKDQFYTHLPTFMQNIVCSYYGLNQRRLRYGGAFRELLDWLDQSQWWSETQIAQYQAEELQKIVHHAYNTVPYYRRVFDERKLKPADIQSVGDLRKLPILTKEDVRKHCDEMVSRDFDRRGLVFAHTSGTSGKSLQFYAEQRAIQFRWALWWRHKRRFDIEFDAPYATFTGLMAVPPSQAHPPYWREDWPMRQTVFTMHHIVPSKVEDIVARLNRGGFEYYSGYPSILYVLADLIQERGLKITAPPKIIFTGAENLYENQRQFISAVFGCPVTDQYGFSEGCGNASRCREDLFHEDFEYGILECENPRQLDADTRQGRIIATGFGSRAMPFLRYDVGDIGTWIRKGCACGRKSIVLTAIEGRVEDYVVTPEGRRILRFDYVFKDAGNVKEAQVVQRQLGSICLRIVRRPSYSSADEELLRREIAFRVSPRLAVAFEYVDEIEREPNGKFRAVRSCLDSATAQDNSLTDKREQAESS